jgi:hypothetical protein
MQSKYIFAVGLSLYSTGFVFAQHANEFYNKGAAITIQAGAEIHVLGDVHEDGGSIANAGIIKLDGHWYNDNATSTQSGTGVVKFQNDKTNLTEDQEIRGVADLTGTNAFYDVDLVNTGTNKLVYLNGVNAEMKNTLEFVTTGDRLRTATTNTATGSAFANYVHISNTANTAIVNAGVGGAAAQYVEGRLRWTVATATNYTFPVGFGLSSTNAVAFGNQPAIMAVTGAGVVEADFNREIEGAVSAPDDECDYKTSRYANHGYWQMTQISGAVTAFGLTVTPHNVAAAPFVAQPCSYTLGRGTAGGAYTTSDGTQNMCVTSFSTTSRTSHTLFGDFAILSNKLYDPKSLVKTICEGESTTLDAYDPASVGSDPATHASPYTYSWTPSGGSAEVTSSLSPIMTTVYTVTVTGQNSCTATTSATVTVNAAPILTASAPCLPTGGAVSITSLGADSYTYPSGGPSVSVAGPYVVIGTLTATGCTAQQSVAVTPCPLPVKLLEFVGKINGGTNDLSWITATEQNTAWHIIEHSKDGTNDWTEMGRVRASGNSSTAHGYEWIDEKPLAKSYYRLRSLDFDGYTDVSNVILLQRLKGENAYIAAYPVPTEGIVRIDYEALDTNIHTVRIIDELGRVLNKFEITPSEGLNSMMINLSDYANAMYMITMDSGTNRRVVRVVKTK